MDHRGHRGVSVEHAREAYDLRRLPGTVARPPRTRSSGALPVGMRACGSAGEHAPAHGRPSTAPPMFERVGIPDVFALDHSGAGILRLRHHRRTDPWVLTNPSAASKSLMPTGTSHGVTPDEQRPPPVAPSLAPRLAYGPQTTTRGRGAVGCFELRRRVRKAAHAAASQVNHRRAPHGCCGAGQLEADAPIWTLSTRRRRRPSRKVWGTTQ